MPSSKGAERTFGQLRVEVFDTAAELGRASARNTAQVIRERVSLQGSARVVIATGNSQLEFVRALRDEPDIPWQAVTIFHMDEYLGIPADHPASFRRWIKENVEDAFSPARVHYIDGDVDDPDAESRRYEQLLREAPLDLVCLGIGENGHIAFNEPYRADFQDPLWVRRIELDDRSRKQQVGEGHFATVDDVPRFAISLTVPALLAPQAVQATVPEHRKASAVRAALIGPVSPACPASVLREHPNAVLFLDGESSSLLESSSRESED
jgi:glucosamine-6-phosphate deaminase